MVTLPFTYNKPAFRLSSTKGTVKKGTKTKLATTVLVQTENGNYVPFDLAGASVTYGNTGTFGSDDLTTGKAKLAVKIRVSDKTYSATGKITQKYDVVTKKPMVVVLTLKEIQGRITDAKVTGITLKNKTALPTSAFEATVGEGNIEVTYKGSEEMKANNLTIGDMTLALTVADGSESGTLLR